MTVYEERRDELERYEFMMGPERGRLAVTLDCITDALVLVGSMAFTVRAHGNSGSRRWTFR